MSEPTYKTRLMAYLHGYVVEELYSECEPEKVKDQLGGTCLWVKTIDGIDVQLNLREIPIIGVMTYDA
ncbi:MAG: hypothetical protein IKE22_14270 [Atopobiaceae bacterium]|nr:hypothetical protein [Atopobiaceae bacterium]